MDSEESIFAYDPMLVEQDFARSAWHDARFAAWFGPMAKRDVLFHGQRGEEFFAECAGFAKEHRSAPADCGDPADQILRSPLARSMFAALSFPPLPGGKSCKPTSWQTDKARRYLSSRHNALLAEHLADAEQIRAKGDHARADELATAARRRYAAFSDEKVPCRKLMSDIDAILGLAESNPPLFCLDGEMGRLINRHLKPDNLGIFLADPKIGKTTDLVSLAVIAGRHVPTLVISTGDETELKLNARMSTNLTCKVAQPEYAGKFGMPVPDCQHNADGSCPIGQSGEPRQNHSWKSLIENGALPLDLAEGVSDGSRTVSGGLYMPCCRCFPKFDGSEDDRVLRRNWKSAVWWRAHSFALTDRETLEQARAVYEVGSPGGGVRVASYPSDTLTVDGIYELLDNLDRNEGFVPRVIILDYADLMKQAGGRDSDKDHDGMRRIWQGLRGITSKLDLLLITATQTNRVDEGCETHTRSSIGRSAKAADNCTFFVTLNQTRAERRAKVLRASKLYAREGGFDPEQQAMCYLWYEVQDAFAFSAPVFCKIKQRKEERD